MNVRVLYSPLENLSAYLPKHPRFQGGLWIYVKVIDSFSELVIRFT